jgi:hypothetical protein
MPEGCFLDGVNADLRNLCRSAVRFPRTRYRGTKLGGPTYVGRATEGTMSPGEIRACYRLYAAHRRSPRPAVVGHFDYLRKMPASFAAQLFARGALAAR